MLRSPRWRAAALFWPLPDERGWAALPARPAAVGGNPVRFAFGVLRCAAPSGPPQRERAGDPGRCRRPLERASLVARRRPPPLSQDALIALKRAEEERHKAVPVATGISPDQLHFDYAITGDRPVWRPLRAFDDGRQTFVEFPASLAVGEAPPLFLVDAKGQAQLVNYRLQGRYYVVDRLFDAAELRLGLKHQDVVRIERAPATGRKGKRS